MRQRRQSPNGLETRPDWPTTDIHALVWASVLTSLRLCWPAAILALSVGLALSAAASVLSWRMPDPALAGLLTFAIGCPLSKVAAISRVKVEARR